MDGLLFHGCDSTSEELTDASSGSTKRCGRCQEELPLEQFSRATNKGGYQSTCKSCYKIYWKTYSEKKRGRDSMEDCRDTVDAESNQMDSLYIMSNSLLPDMVKIGRSNGPEERARNLGASHPFRIVVEHTYGDKGFLEKPIHDRLKHRRVDGGSGREWFNLSVEQADTLVRGCIVEHELS